MDQAQSGSDDPPGWMERAMHAAVPMWLVGLGVLVACAAAIGFGAMVLDPRNTTARAVAAVPETLGRLVSDLGPWHPVVGGTYPRLPAGLWINRAQPLVDPGYILLTAFDEGRSRYVVRLLRLSDGRVVRDYAPDFAGMAARSAVHSALIDLARDKSDRRAMPMHPLLLPDGGVLVHDTSPMLRLDACGRTVWMIDGIFHHSLEAAPDGTFWATYRAPRSQEPGVSPHFIEEGLAHFSPDGRMLQQTSIIALLDANGLGTLWRSRPYSDDPFHLNDIEPVPGSGPYWQAGDLLLSLRNLSLVLLYRPSTGRVIWSRGLPWRFQHDVSVIDDHRISVFDNHWRFAWDQPEQAEPDGTNRMLVYDFATDRVSEPMARPFREQDIRTRAQGRATPLPNGDVMIEETELGRVLRVAPDGTVRWRYISADAQGRRYALRWTRYLDPTTNQAGISAAENARCP